MSPETERKIRVWVPAIVYMGLIFSVSSISAVKPRVGSFRLFDKIAHAVEFTGLGLFLTMAFRGSLAEARRVLTPLFAIAIGFAIGVLDEIYQLTVPGRAAEFLDWVGDAVGVLIGTGLGALHARLVSRMRVYRSRIG